MARCTWWEPGNILEEGNFEREKKALLTTHADGSSFSIPLPNTVSAFSESEVSYVLRLRSHLKPLFQT